jgi:predicted  nucleic acid-binding Zn-ribbon protein
MAEVEYQGIKVSGGKLLLVLPLLGTLGGGLWGGFEFYKDYMTMKEQIQNYVAPDLSAIDRQVSVIETQLATEIEGMKSAVDNMQTEMRQLKIDLNNDLTIIYDNMNEQDGRNRENIKTVRDVISGFEVRMGNKMDRLDDKIDTLEEELDRKIKRALDNPLANGG